MAPHLLDQIDEPGDLRELTHEELAQVAQDARDTIISVITERGGHLASNLGVVELTLALHRIFDSPTDRIVWDTTNQLYTHKLVTGRRDEFKDIRLEGGLSGFGEPSESLHDTLAAGHAGTGLSIALGIAEGAENRKLDSWTIAVVGDGAMTSGSSFEALNNIVHLNPEKLIVILNDNGMSISENIGFLTNWRKRLITHPEYQSMIERMKALSKRMPTGELMYGLVKRFNTALAGFIVPTMFWTEMGFQYLGPIDGHDFKQLEQTLKQARTPTGLVPLVHVVTHKGHGYEPAEDDPVRFHQPSSPLGDASGAPTYSSVFAQTITRIMQEDESVVGISAAMLEGTGLVGVQREFPERVFDVGIAEQHAVSMAAGMASAGLNPFVSIYSTFLQRAFDQIVHDVCLQNLPVTLIADRAGIVGEDGKTHHGAFDITYLRCLPNAVVAAPSNENELQHLVYTSYKHRGPFAIRIARGAAVGVPLDSDLKELPLGKGYVVREGRDVVIFGLGKANNAAEEAAEILAEYGIDCGVVNPVFVKPLDIELLLEHRSQRPPDCHGGRERDSRRVRLGGAGSARRCWRERRSGPPYRYAGLLHRARHCCRPATTAATGRTGHCRKSAEHILPERYEEISRQRSRPGSGSGGVAGSDVPATKRGSTVGTFSWPLRISSMDGRETRDVEATVDTGAAYTTLPGSLLREIGVTPMGKRRFLLADGRRIELDYGESPCIRRRRERGDSGGLWRRRCPSPAGSLHPGGSGPSCGPSGATTGPDAPHYVLGEALSRQESRLVSLLGRHKGSAHTWPAISKPLKQTEPSQPDAVPD